MSIGLPSNFPHKSLYFHTCNTTELSTCGSKDIWRHYKSSKFFCKYVWQPKKFCSQYNTHPLNNSVLWFNIKGLYKYKELQKHKGILFKILSILMHHFPHHSISKLIKAAAHWNHAESSNLHLSMFSEPSVPFKSLSLIFTLYLWGIVRQVIPHTLIPGWMILELLIF